MPVPKLIAPLLAALIPAALPGAQQTPRNSFLVGGGVDLLTTERAAATPGFALQGAYERRLGDSRFSLRFEYDYWSRGVRYDGEIEGNSVGSVARIRTILGGGVLGIYRFAPNARFRPYALAGIGYRQLSLRNEADWTPDAALAGRCAEPQVAAALSTSDAPAA